MTTTTEFTKKELAKYNVTDAKLADLVEVLKNK